MDVNDILIFSRVAQAGSFSLAAKLLGMPVSTVSRRVAELEAELKATLLTRTTRSLKITDVGRTYLEHAQAITAELEKAQAYASNLQAIPRGKLKITATPDFGNLFLVKIVSDFLHANPHVEVEVVLTERVVSLIDEGFDLAVRIGELEDSTLVSRQLGSIELQLFASPEFLKTHGSPKSCGDISKLPCVLFTGAEEPEIWRLDGPRGRMNLPVSGRVRSNSMDAVRDFALLGEGIALMPHFLCAPEVKAGRLRVVLGDWVQTAGPIHAVYPGQRFILPKTRAFVDLLASRCANVPWRYKK